MLQYACCANWKKMDEDKVQYACRQSSDDSWYEDYWSEYNSIKKTETILEHHDSDDVCRIDGLFSFFCNSCKLHTVSIQ